MNLNYEYGVEVEAKQFSIPTFTIDPTEAACWTLVHHIQEIGSASMLNVQLVLDVSASPIAVQFPTIPANLAVGKYEFEYGI